MDVFIYLFIYEFLSRIASSVLKVNLVINEGPAYNKQQSNDHNGLWFIDIALKLGAQLSISITIFQVFGMTRL